MAHPKTITGPRPMQRNPLLAAMLPILDKWAQEARVKKFLEQHIQQQSVTDSLTGVSVG